VKVIKSGNIGCDDDAFERSRTRICARLDVDIFLDERIFAHSQNNICATRETCVPDQNALSVKQALFWSARAPSHYGNGALCVPTPTDIDVRGVVIVEQRVTGDVGASTTCGNQHRKKHTPSDIFFLLSLLNCSICPIEQKGTPSINLHLCTSRCDAALFIS
jgi:hypothetical protein